MSVIDELERLFPDYRSPTRSAEWEALKQRLVRDQQVSGKVVAKSPFGAWIDLGVGFSSLLEIIAMAGLTPERYHADQWCSIGSEITAFIGRFNDDGRQIGLWQDHSWRGQYL